jgi:hypothetical protein
MCSGSPVLLEKKRHHPGTCYFLQRDEASCGKCFHKCGHTQHCKKGVCKCNRKTCVPSHLASAACPFSSDLTWGKRSLKACGSACVNLQNDARNCGRCVSPPFPHQFHFSIQTPAREIGAPIIAHAAEVFAVVSSETTRPLASHRPRIGHPPRLFVLPPRHAYPPCDALCLIDKLVGSYCMSMTGIWRLPT